MPVCAEVRLFGARLNGSCPVCLEAKRNTTRMLDSRAVFTCVRRQEAGERICAFVPCGHTVCEGCALGLQRRRATRRMRDSLFSLLELSSFQGSTSAFETLV